ncbi:MAG: TolC family protein [Prevotella sp.]|nr:TolC family protein [Prevotella sp.]
MIVWFITLLAANPVSAQTTYSLQQLKDSALSHNLSMRKARYDIDAAREQRKEAFTKYFPNVTGTGVWFNANKGMAKMDVNPSEMIPPSLGGTLSMVLPQEALMELASPVSISMMKNGTIAGITAVQPVFAGGQIVNGNKLAKVGEEVSSLQLELSENEVVTTVEQYYWQLVAMQEKVRTLNAVDSLLSSIHRDVDVAVRAGVALNNDLLQVQLRQNDVESQHVKLMNGISIVKMLLAQYCGLATSRTDDGMADFNVELPDIGKTPLDLPSLVGGDARLPMLPEYQLLQKQVEATDLQHRMTVGKNMPSVAVGAGYNYHNLLEKDHTFGMVFATVSIPISDWWGGSHAIKRSKIEHQKAADALSDNAELLKIRMQKSWNDVNESYQQLQIAQRSILQAEENLRLNRNYYKAGTSRMSDLLEAQLLYQQALDKRTDAYADYCNKLLAYKVATGQER